MVHISKKVAFIANVMEELGYVATKVTKTLDYEDGKIYWLEGLTGFFNSETREHMSFIKAQSLAKSLVNAVKKSSGPVDTKYNFWKHDLILTYKDIANIVGPAIQGSSYNIWIGSYKSIVYCNRKRVIKDESTKTTLKVIK